MSAAKEHRRAQEENLDILDGKSFRRAELMHLFESFLHSRNFRRTTAFRAVLRGMPDPIKVSGSNAEKSLAFHQSYGALLNRIKAFTALSIASLERIALQNAVDEIAQTSDDASV